MNNLSARVAAGLLGLCWLALALAAQAQSRSDALYMYRGADRDARLPVQRQLPLYGE